MKKKLFIYIFFVLTILLTGYSQKQNISNKKDPNFIFHIDSNEMKADERFLSSDELEGRETGERGLKIAALYLKTQFEKIGLKPINNSYSQKFNVLKVYPSVNPFLSITTVKGDESAEFKKDFFPISTGKTTNEISSDIVFVGYGITSPENNYDDYKNIDVKNKTVLIIANSPRENDYSSPFGGIKKAEPFKNYNMKVENAIKHGAAGVLYMMEVNKKTLSVFVKSFGNFINRANYKMLAEKDKESVPFAYISKDFADKILAPAKLTIDDLKNKIDSTLTPSSLKIQGSSVLFKPNIKREVLETENVVGYIEGCNPELKDEYIVFSCHYDHLGITPDGKIFNGADDNASGTTGILEIAKTITGGKERPQRSLLFLAFSGEEKGLFGSTYYSDNPLIPLKQTVFDLNIDMIGRIDEKYKKLNKNNYIYLIGPKIMGGELPDFIDKINQESAKLLLDGEFDDIKDPNMFYRRSDHYNFAKHGIPSIFFFNGEHEDYHKITDKVDKINFDILLKRIELIGYSGLKIADHINKIKAERAFP